MRLLIIDDNAAIRTTLRLLLSDRFDDIATVGDPNLIPAILKPGNIDVVLLDMNFGKGCFDGQEGMFWLSRIKEIPDSPAVVMITAFGDVPLAVEAMKAGAEDFITKPWDNDELMNKIDSAISKNRSAKATAKKLEMADELESITRRRNSMTLEEAKLSHIREIIGQCGGNLSAASERLGINRQTLYNTLNRHKK